jgi:hypothetical protein
MLREEGTIPRCIPPDDLPCHQFLPLLVFIPLFLFEGTCDRGDEIVIPEPNVL